MSVGEAFQSVVFGCERPSELTQVSWWAVTLSRVAAGAKCCNYRFPPEGQRGSEGTFPPALRVGARFQRVQGIPQDKNRDVSNARDL